MKTVISVVLGASVGFVWGSAGMTFMTWQYWVSLLLIVLFAWNVTR